MSDDKIITQLEATCNRYFGYQDKVLGLIKNFQEDNLDDDFNKMLNDVLEDILEILMIFYIAVNQQSSGSQKGGMTPQESLELTTSIGRFLLQNTTTTDGTPRYKMDSNRIVLFAIIGVLFIGVPIFMCLLFSKKLRQIVGDVFIFLLKVLLTILLIIPVLLYKAVDLVIQTRNDRMQRIRTEANERIQANQLLLTATLLQLTSLINTTQMLRTVPPVTYIETTSQDIFTQIDQPLDTGISIGRQLSAPATISNVSYAYSALFIYTIMYIKVNIYVRQSASYIIGQLKGIYGDYLNKIHRIMTNMMITAEQKNIELKDLGNELLNKISRFIPKEQAITQYNMLNEIATSLHERRSMPSDLTYMSDVIQRTLVSRNIREMDLLIKNEETRKTVREYLSSIFTRGTRIRPAPTGIELTGGKKMTLKTKKRNK